MRVVIPPPASRAALLALLAVVTSTAGCATKGDLRNVQTELRTLSARSDSLYAELVRQRRVTVDTLGRQSQQITDLQGRFLQELRDIADGLDQLMELTRQNASDIRGLEQQMAALGRTAAVGPRGGGVVGRETGSTLGPDEAFQAAQEEFNARRWSAAELGFNDFLNRFPDDELTGLAQYRLAEIRYQQGLFEEAIDAFLRVQEDHPEDSRVPDALYRVGMIHMDRDSDDEARRYFNLVINTYPESMMAEMARDRLRELGG